MSLTSISWRNTIKVLVLYHLFLLELDPVTKHLVSYVLVEVDEHLLVGLGGDSEIVAGVDSVVVERISQGILLFQVLIEDPDTLGLVVLERHGGLIRKPRVHDSILATVERFELFGLLFRQLALFCLNLAYF